MPDERYTEKTLEAETLYKGKILDLQWARVKLPDGREATREVVRHRGAVGIVALDSSQNVWLVRQYRYATGTTLLELPAGKLEPGEKPLRTAQRELVEEVGLEAAAWEQLCSFYTSPGFSDERLTLYLATGLRCADATQQEPVEGEFLVRERWTLQAALQAVENGRIEDAKTVVGLLMARARQTGSPGEGVG